MALKVGEALPPISGETQDGSLNLADFRGAKSIVLWAYPKDNTSGCTIEARDFSARAGEFDNLDAVLVGISRDTVESHREFAADHGLTFKLLADADGRICTTLGVLAEPNGNAKRTTFIIDKQGTVRYIFEGVKVAGHTDEVLEKVREMKS